MARLAREGGQAIVLVALGMPALLAGAGLGIDAGLQFVERRHVQVAADAAAFAAAASMAANWSDGQRSQKAKAAASAYALANGYDGATSNTVTVNIPPSSGPHLGDSAYAEVKVSATVRTAFIRILGSSFQTVTVSARAVGGVVSAKPYAIIALSRTASPGISANGTTQIQAQGAGMLANSSASNALAVNGSGVQIQIQGGPIDVVGGYQWSGNPDVTPAPTTGAPGQNDPLAYLARPDGSGLPLQPAVNVNSGTTTISPGIYPSISVGGNGTVKMQPGTYVIKGGGISVTGNGNLNDETSGDGQGVFIFNACSDFPAASGSCGAISDSGNGRIKLEKATSGTWKGMSIWQPCENKQPMSMNGGGRGGGSSRNSLETSGTIYLACAAATVTGDAMVNVQDGQLVADTVTVTGNAGIEVQWQTDVADVSRVPALVE